MARSCERFWNGIPALASASAMAPAWASVWYSTATSAKDSPPSPWPLARPESRAWKDAPPSSSSTDRTTNSASACSEAALWRATLLALATRPEPLARTRARGPGWRSRGLDGGGDDGLAGAVVAAELHAAGAREVFGEAQEEADVGTPETVDGLVGVADRGQAGTVACQQAQQPVLDGVHVLVLVDGHDRPAGPVRLGQHRVGVQHPYRQREQVVEVDQPASGEGLVVACEQLVVAGGGTAPGEGHRPLAGRQLAEQAAGVTGTHSASSATSATRSA